MRSQMRVEAKQNTCQRNSDRLIKQVEVRKEMKFQTVVR